MNHDEFVAKQKSAATQLMQAMDDTQSLLNVFTDISASLMLEQEFIDAGVAMTALMATLGSGPASNRAKINKVRL